MGVRHLSPTLNGLVVRPGATCDGLEKDFGFPAPAG